LEFEDYQKIYAGLLNFEKKASLSEVLHTQTLEEGKERNPKIKPS
jgi:hypothetical protein